MNSIFILVSKEVFVILLSGNMKKLPVLAQGLLFIRIRQIISY